MARKLTYASAINEALNIAMDIDSNVICYGLGVDDPKGIFGTTLGLQEQFGSDRVFDTPTSENAMTGIGIGAALNGKRPVMMHQRLDFFLLAMDQLVNNAAKWRYMFGGQDSVPITIRLIIGRGWGQGPTHSQSLQAWFSHIPGLKVVMPSSPADAKGLLLASIFDDDPVIYLEHRWLHNLEGDVPEGDHRAAIGEATVVKEGTDLTIVSSSYMTIEALHSIDHLMSYKLSCELIDLRSIRPMDWEKIFLSVNKTGRLLVLDTASETGSIANDIIARVSMNMYGSLKQAPCMIAMPDYPSPTSPALSVKYYKGAEDIVQVIGDMFKQDFKHEKISEKRTALPDVPGDWFKGPF